VKESLLRSPDAQSFAWKGRLHLTRAPSESIFIRSGSQTGTLNCLFCRCRWILSPAFSWYTNTLDIRGAPTTYDGFMRRFRIIGRRFGAASSTLSRPNSSRYQSQDASRYTRTAVHTETLQ